ncbi:hypothetical protein DdX_13905 [Ditylenchus destructor]|uniref:Uncharacterized protein n=1 Tax=Ditylenchus destructor TaxID=166010 RepID=A0AAD4QZ32_9BILA|nr:hypothetical protein DdX_13905 [Ditylenchus destructor]
MFDMDGSGRTGQAAYLQNSEGFSVRFNVWNEAIEELNEILRLHQIISLSNLDVRQYRIETGGENITDAQVEFHYNPANSKALVMKKLNDEEKTAAAAVDYRQIFRLTGITSVRSRVTDIVIWPVVSSVKETGIYGVVGDPKKTKIPFFIQCSVSETEERAQMYVPRSQFRYIEGRAFFPSMFC